MLEEQQCGKEARDGHEHGQASLLGHDHDASRQDQRREVQRGVEGAPLQDVHEGKGEGECEGHVGQQGERDMLGVKDAQYHKDDDGDANGPHGTLAPRRAIARELLRQGGHNKGQEESAESRRDNPLVVGAGH